MVSQRETILVVSLPRRDTSKGYVHVFFEGIKAAFCGVPSYAQEKTKAAHTKEKIITIF
jgi:hypothetical protein